MHLAALTAWGHQPGDLLHTVPASPGPTPRALEAHGDWGGWRKIGHHYPGAEKRVTSPVEARKVPRATSRPQGVGAGWAAGSLNPVASEHVAGAPHGKEDSMSQGGAGRGQDFSARPSVHLARGRAHRSTPGMRHGCRAGARDATRGSGDARSSSSAARGV